MRKLLATLTTRFCLTSYFVILVVLTSVAQSVTITGNESINRCESNSYTITLQNNSGNSLTNLSIVARLENLTGFSYVNGTSLINMNGGGNVALGNPTISALYSGLCASPVAPYLSWDVDALLGATTLLDGHTISITFNLQTDCNAVSGSLNSLIDYKIAGTPMCDNAGALNLTVNPGAVTIKVTPNVISQELGNNVTWTLTIENTGFGVIKNAKVTDVLGAGLNYVSCTQGGVNSGQTTTWDSNVYAALSEIAPGDVVTMNITATVAQCQFLDNVANVRFGCDAVTDCFNTASDGGTATASVQRIVKTPLIDYTPPNITFNYCQDYVDVNFPISNIGDGVAQSLKTSVNFSPLTVSNLSVGASYDTNNQRFEIANPMPGGSYVLSFRLNYASWCGGIFPAKELLWQMEYEDDCGNLFNSPLKMSLINQPVGAVSLALTKGGAGSVIQIGDVITYSINSSYTGPLTCGSGGNVGAITVVDAIPTGFVVTNADGGVYVPGGGGTGGTITWTYLPPATLSKTITVQSPLIANCETYCNTTFTNNVSATGFDCCGCTLSATASETSAIECAEGVTSQKIASSPIERCGDIIYTNTYTFDPASTVTLNNLVFTEHADSEQGYNNNLSITLNGAPIMGQAVLTNTTDGVGGTVVMDFSGSPATSLAGKELIIQYTLTVTESTVAACTAGTFYSWSSLRMGASGSGCLGDGVIYETVPVTVGVPAMSLAINGMGESFNKCETQTITLKLTQTTAANPKDVKLKLSGLNYYVIDPSNPGAITCSGDVTPLACLPTVNGNGDYNWTFNDLFTGQYQEAIIQFDVQKRCSGNGDLVAIAYFDDRCTDDATSDELCSVTATKMPSLLLNGDLLIEKTPEVYYATTNTVQWSIYLTNRGTGTAYNVWVDDVLGAGLHFTSAVVDNMTGVTVTGNLNHSGTVINGANIAIAYMTSGERRMITITAEVIDCDNLTSSATASWGCIGVNCQVPVSDNSTVLIPAPNLINTNTITPSGAMNACANPNGFITLRNAGQVTCYNLQVTETLPAGLLYVTGTTRWRLNGGGWNGPNVAYDPVPTTSPLVWTKTQIPGLATSNPGDIIEIEFQMIVDCPFTGGDLKVATQYENPCADVFTNAESKYTIPFNAPNIAVTCSRANEPIGCNQNITWNITVTNNSGYTLPVIWVEDIMDAAYTYVSSSGDASYTYDNGSKVGQKVTWELKNVPTATTVTLTLTARTDFSPCSPNLKNTVQVWSGCGNADGDSSTKPGVDSPDNNLCLGSTSVSAVRTETRQPTVSFVSIGLNPSSIVSSNDTTLMTMTIANTGATNARNVDLVVTLPTGLTYNAGSSLFYQGVDGTGTTIAKGDPTITGNVLTYYNVANNSSNLTNTLEANGGSDTYVLKFSVKSSDYTTQDVGFNLLYYDCCVNTQYSNSTTKSVTALIPTITSATYDVTTAVLVLTCTNIKTGNVISPAKITLTGEGGTTYILTTSNVPASSSTFASITLNSADKAAVNQIINKNGSSSTGGTTYNLAAADDWIANITSGNSADAINSVTVSNVAVPTITSSTYNAATGALVVTGTGYLKLNGGTNDIDVSKLTITGEGGSTYTLTTTSVEITNDTSFTLTLNATDIAAVNQIVNKNGTISKSGTTYNLAAAEDWTAGADASIDVADLTGNGITASNLALPTVTTQAITSIGITTATGNGNITVLGIPNPTQHGVCWSISPDPTIEDVKTEQGTVSVTGPFTSNMTSLSPNTVYYVRAYATNSVGTVYGDEISFCTPPEIIPPLVGDGTSGNPYQIATWMDLYWLSQTSSAWWGGIYFIQTADITFPSTISQWDNNQGWNTIGNTTVNFRGSYNGGGHTISGLFINRPLTDYMAFIGVGMETSTISNLGLINVDITGKAAVGGLVAYHNGSISNAYCTGSVTGTLYVGGLVGGNRGAISNTYSSATVYGTNNSGGLVGMSYGPVSHSYSNGIVSGSGTLGGLLGVLYGGSFTNCFWDTETSGLSSSAAGTGLTSAQMKTISRFTHVGWDFSSVWAMTSSVNSGYPSLLSQVPSGTWTAPTVTTGSVSNITYTSATINGTLTILGEPQPYHVGICWGTETEPTVSDDTTDTGGFSIPGAFSSDMSNLTAGIKYYARAYATNVDGTVYGDEISFTTLLPTIASATYNANTGVMVLTCTNINAGDIIRPAYFTITGEGNLTYSLTTGNVTASSSTLATITLNALDKSNINQIFNKNGNSSSTDTTYNLAAADDWDANITSGNSADATNAVTASNVAVPTITSATYDAASGALVVTGTGYLKLSGPTNDIDVSKLTVRGDGGSTYTLTTASVEITSDTIFTVILNDYDKDLVNQIINRNGTRSKTGTTYNLAAAEDWAAGADMAVVVANLSGNRITASNLDTPTVTTQAVTNIDTTSATGNGNIANLGVPKPSQHGVCWNTTGNPTIFSFKTELGDTSATGPFTSNITGLLPHTTYHVKAYATNSVGTVYGDEVSFTTLQLPAVTTQAVTDLDTTTATGNGNITDLGNPNPTQYGVCWSTSTDPTIDDFRTEQGDTSATGPFTSEITGLIPGTTYFIKAYATNEAGTAYGGEVIFTSLLLPAVTTQAVTDIDTTFATGNGNITLLGIPNPIQYGVCWSTTSNPTIADFKTEQGDTSATGPFTSEITGLTSGVTYFVRAYTTNAAGTAYGDEVSFQTLHLPVVTTTAISSVTMTSASTGGNITDEGGTPVTARGVCWSNSPNPTILDSISTDGIGSGAFTSSLDELTTGMTYFVRAYATNYVGTSYGGEVSFTTYLFPGSGIEADPFQIANLVDLDTLAENPDYWDNYFIQTADIDASATSTWNSGTGWLPIGNVTTAFSGDYNGQGHTISRLFINRSSDNQGLFGFTSGGTIQNLGLTHVNILGGSNAGGLIGQCHSIISQCFSTGSVTGGIYCGGLVGNGQYSTIINCYSMAGVTGTRAGGLVGIGGIITNCYSNGAVSGSEFTGLVGQSGCIVNNSFYDIETSGITSLTQGKTTEEMKTMATFTNSGWAFPTIWHIDESTTNPDNDGYPSLAWQGLNNRTKPNITTQEVTNITATTAVGHGNIIDLGISNPTQHGVCWSLSNNPTLADSITEEGVVTSTGTFTSNMTRLTIGATYYVRAYATNDLGTGYGNVVSFKMQYTSTVSTGEITNVSSTTATGKVTISKYGNPEPTQQGVCWSTSPNPTIGDDKTEEGIILTTTSTTMTYTEGDISTDYDFRTPAQRSKCPGTMIVSIPFYATISSVDVEYDMMAQGGGLMSEQLSRLRCFSMGGESETQLFSGVGNTEGTYHYNRTGLHIANNVSEGGDIYFDLHAGRTNGDIPGDTIINCDTILINCDQFNDCDTLIHCDTVVVKCDSDFNKVVNGTWKITVYYSAPVDSFESSITGLSPYTTYFVRAYSTNEAGTGYGNEVHFRTLPTSPIIETQAVTLIADTTATGNGNITYLGAPNPSQYGVCWNTTGNPTVADSFTGEGEASVTGPFTSAITGLSPNTTYYVKAFAINVADTVYGDQVSFTTLLLPTVSTQAVTAITTTTATGNGNILSLGVPNPSQHGVCWSTSTNPTIDDDKTEEGAVSATGAFTSAITGLSPYTTYHVKAFATNNAGTVYGDEVTFTTLYAVPTNLILSNSIIASLVDTCFDAINEITVSTVTVAATASANFIAGYSVTFLPGFRAFSGSYVHAQITEDASFCNVAGGSPIVSQPKQKSLDLTKATPVIEPEMQVKVYPNPNNGQFTLEMKNVESGARVSIYNMLGAIVYQSAATNETNHKIDLPGIRKGIYFVKVLDGKEQMTRKMVVN